MQSAVRVQPPALLQRLSPRRNGWGFFCHPLAPPTNPLPPLNQAADVEHRHQHLAPDQSLRRRWFPRNGVYNRDMLTTVTIAIVAFALTNIDDIFLLTGFFSDPSQRPLQIIVGQYVGIGFLIAASGLCASPHPRMNISK